MGDTSWQANRILQRWRSVLQTETEPVIHDKQTMPHSAGCALQVLNALPPAARNSHPSAACAPASSRSRAQHTLEGLCHQTRRARHTHAPAPGPRALQRRPRQPRRRGLSAWRLRTASTRALAGRARAVRAACNSEGATSAAHGVQAGLQRLVLLGGLRRRGLRGALLGRRRARQVRHRRARHVQQHLYAGAGLSLVVDTQC